MIPSSILSFPFELKIISFLTTFNPYYLLKMEKKNMINNHFIFDMYKAIDAKSPTGMCEYVTEDATFRFANLPEVRGKSNIISFLEGFFQSIKAIKHADIETWNSGNGWFVTGTVTYTRHDDSCLAVPFSVLLKMQENLIKDYLIFVDASELYK